MKWIMENANGILLALTGTVTAASLIANLTPTDADNQFIAKIGKVVNLLAANWRSVK